MALKNSDGTPYRAGTLTTSTYPKEDVSLHNFVWQAEPLEISTVKETESSKVDTNPQVEVKTEVSLEIKSNNLEKTKGESPKEEEDKKSKLHDGVMVHCLPQKTDTSYGNKFVFEAIIIERGDLAISLWTPNKKIKPGSIIYPTAKLYSDGYRFVDFRWWKIQKTEPYNNGTLLVAVITGIQPAFSN